MGVHSVGIDYGSKLAGTSVLVWRTDQEDFQSLQSRKGQDADQLILDWVAQHRPTFVYLDAPLSLPGVYRHLPSFSDYFFRRADREALAMSPMFLGGLTARAMQLAAQLQEQGATVVEVYPGGLARLADLSTWGYKKEVRSVSAVLEVISRQFSLSLQDKTFKNWHAVDALLAWCVGYRIENQRAVVCGIPEEGQLFY